MFNLKGGVKLKPNYRAGDKIRPVIDMLQSPHADLSLIAYTSGKGFVFRLDVQPGNSSYLGFNNQSNAFTNEVLSLCLKLVVVYSPDPNNPNVGEGEPIEDFENFGYPGNSFDPQIPKSTESKQSLFDEARYQQQAWKTSIYQNGIEVCPPVCDLSILTNIGSGSFLDLLESVIITSQTSAENKDRSNRTIEYLRRQLNPNYSIGVLSMHTVIQSVQFADFTDRYDINTSEGLDMYKRLAAQTMRLFLQEQMIHCDLHSGNALVSDATNPPTCDIIDFGRVVRFTEHSDDQFFTAAEKEPLEQRYNEELAKYFAIRTPPRRGPSPPTKPEFVVNLLKYIRSIDLSVMQKWFGLNRPQMKWVNEYLKKGRRETIIFENTFDDLLVRYMERQEGRRPSQSTVNGWEGVDMIDLNPRRVTPQNFDITNAELGLPPSAAPLGAPAVAPAPFVPAPVVPAPVVPVTSVKWYKNKLYFYGVSGICIMVVLLKLMGKIGGKSRRHKRKNHNKTKRNRK